MTPERVAEIADLHTVSLHVKPRMERAIRQAVNEFAEEAGERFSAMHGKGDIWLSSMAASNLVRALKLPEE